MRDHTRTIAIAAIGVVAMVGAIILKDKDIFLWTLGSVLIAVIASQMLDLLPRG